MHVCVCVCVSVCVCVCARRMHKVSWAAVCKASRNALSLSPVNLPQSLTEEKRDVSGWKGETHTNDIVNTRLHSVKKCKSTVGNRAITAEDYAA